MKKELKSDKKSENRSYSEQCFEQRTTQTRRKSFDKSRRLGNRFCR